MDKKNTIIGLGFIVAAIGLSIYSASQAPEPAAPAPAPAVADAPASPAQSQPAATNAPAPLANEPTDRISFRPAGAETTEQTWTLRNDFIEVTFTNIGGAIQKVALVEKVDSEYKYPATLKSETPYLVNRFGERGILSLALPDALNPADPSPLPEAGSAAFELVNLTDERIEFRYVSPQGVEISRSYDINHETEGPLPYEINTSLRLRNAGAAALQAPSLYLSLGTFPPTAGDNYGQYLNFGSYDGGDADFYPISKFRDGGGFLGIGGGPGVDQIYEEMERGLVWGALKNQFFTSILTTPDHLGRSFYVEDVIVNAEASDQDMAQGMTAYVEYAFDALIPGQPQVLEGQLYVGPKEYARLDKMPHDQERVMQFGYLSAISKLLLVSLIGLHSILGNWGVAIVVLTLIIKTLLFPLTQKQVKSAKRMAKFSKPLAELREKYKDEPQKLNEEMMKFWREHKINPMAGCLPIFLQMPIFIGLFFMLRTASELRFAEFLWIEDLARPDTVSWIPDLPETIPFFGGAVHLLPLIMGSIMFVQMRMTPTPTTNAAQKNMMMFMPVVFLFFCYNFPAGLVLYWTVQNLFTIVQQVITNRSHNDDEEELTLEALEKKAAQRRKEGKEEPPKKSFMERLEAKKKEQQMRLEKGSPRQKPKRRK